MSRVGKQPIALPKGVTATINGSEVTVKGPKGELSFAFSPELTIGQEDGTLVVSRPSDERRHRALHGLTRALLNNMVTGVSAGFTRVLEIEGVGYRAEMQGKDLVLYVGYSHPVRFQPRGTVTYEIPGDSKGRVIIVNGTDKQEVGEMAALIRKTRPPEPYLGKGIRYRGERIIRKAGKAGKGK